MNKPNMKQLQEQITELENKWKRALADYQNLEKRTQNERAAFVKMANVGLLAKIIPIVDDLERAQLHVKNQGLDMVVEQFARVLKEEGLEIINPEGSEFEAATMEAVDQTKGEVNKVIKVILKGYRLNGVILRPAKVVVGTNK